MKGTQLAPTEYLYVSARLRARDAQMVGRAALQRLSELASADDVAAALIAEGVLDEQAKRSFFAALDEMLQRELALVRASLPDPAVLDFLLYPTDCHNVKVALKCHYRGMDPTPMLEENGSVPLAQILGLPQEIPARLPAHMREAIGKARLAFEQNGDARALSLALDAACFADMAQASAEIPLAKEMVAVRADTANLLTCRRLLTTQRSAAGEVLLRAALLPGGSLGDGELLAAFAGGEEAFAAFAARTPYAKVIAAPSFAEAERLAEDLCTAVLSRAKAIPFGVEVALAYAQGLLISVKNLRILYTAKKTGAEKEALLGRLRESYV